MRLKAHELPGRTLAPVYLISGDEPLLLIEAADAVRAAARAAGFEERQVFFADRKFAWSTLLEAGQAMSLFATRRILDVRMESDLDTANGKLLAAYCAAPPPDTLLVLTAPRVDLRRNWARAVDAVGVITQVWPLRPNEMPRWLRGRAQALGVRLDDEAFALLLQRVEGNLLAAHQELERLRLLGDGGTWSHERLLEATADSAHYDAFGWVDAVFAGDPGRAIRVLDVLHAQGTPPLTVLGALNSQLRRLAVIADAPGNRENNLKQAGFIADRARTARALLGRHSGAELTRLQARLSEVDRRVKGFPGDPWQVLAEIGVALAR